MLQFLWAQSPGTAQFSGVLWLCSPKAEIKTPVRLVLWILDLSSQLNLSSCGCRPEVPLWCWLSARGCSELLEASHIPCHDTHNFYTSAVMHQILLLLWISVTYSSVSALRRHDYVGLTLGNQIYSYFKVKWLVNLNISAKYFLSM